MPGSQSPAGTEKWDRDQHLNTAQDVFEENIRELGRVAGEFPSNPRLFENELADSLTMQGLIYGRLRNREGQTKTLRQSLELAQAMYDRSPTPKARLRVLGLTGNLADIHRQNAEIDEAITGFERSIAGLESLLEKDPANGTVKRFLANDCSHLADCFAQTGQPDKALARFRQAMQSFPPEKRNGQKGMEAVYLVGSGQIDAATSAYQEFAACQTQFDEPHYDALWRLVSDSAKILVAIEARESVSGSAFATGSHAASLRQLVATTAVQALGSLDAAPNGQVESLDRRLETPALAPLRATKAFLEWNQRRQ